MKPKMTCPRCKVEYSGYPAISRRDNKTKICSDCGTDEGLFDFKYSMALKKASKSDMNELELAKDDEQDWLWRLEE